MLLYMCLIPALMAQTLTFSVDDYCPYYCKDQQSQVPRLAAKPGFVVEIIEAAFRRKGYDIAYVFRPWARGIREVTEGKVNGLLIASKGDASRHVFPANEQGRSLGCFYVAAKSHWTFNGVASLQGIRLGVVKGYEYSEPLNGFLKHNPHNKEIVYLTGQLPMKRILNMIELGRLDVTMADANISDYLIHQMGNKPRVKKSSCGQDFLNFYVTFSPVLAGSKQQAKILSDAMDELRENGKLQEILDRYGISDWQ